MLYFHAYKDRRNNVTDAYVNTFEWLWDHPKYKLWENGHSSSLLWLQGKPGSGKSTLANFCRSRVQTRVGISPKRQTIVVDFFYSVRGGNLQSGHYWMLRSILYQFLLQTPGLWDNYRNDFRECQEIGKSETWRSHRDQSSELWSLNRSKSLLTSLGSVHSPWLKLTAYVIVDALDESEETDRQNMIHLFRKISQRDLGWPISFKILLTSRPSPKIEMVLADCHTIILEDETATDIVNYVDAETRRIATEILKCTHEDLAFISSHLKKASQGVFLWVKLVLQELDERATEGFCTVAELEQLLLTIPTDLRELYQRIQDKIIRGISKNVRECQTLFRWIAFSPRPLTVEEVLEVIALSACPLSGTTRTELQRNRLRNTEDVRRRLISLCGNLVEVKGRIVQFIHTSAREHLLATTSYDTISVSPGDSLFEIANSCLLYIDSFQHELEQDRWVSEKIGNPRGHSVDDIEINLNSYIDLINDFPLLRGIFGYEPAFIQILDHELSSRGSKRSLRLTMSSCSKVLQPVVLEAIAQTDFSVLRQLILNSDQINAQYAVPRHDRRFEQEFIHSHFFDQSTSTLTLCQIAMLLVSNVEKSLVDLLHSLGAELDGQDSLGRTAIHLSILCEAWASGLLKETLDEIFMLTISHGFIGLGRPAIVLGADIWSSSRLGPEYATHLFRHSVILSAAIKSNPALMAAIPSTGVISPKMLLSIVSKMPTCSEPLSIPQDSLVEIIWNLHSTHQRLLRWMVDHLSYMSLIKGYHRKVLPHASPGYLVVAQTKSILSSARERILQSRAFTRHLLALGANVIIQPVQSQSTDPVDLTLKYNLTTTNRLFLDNIKSKADYQMSLAKNEAEKSRLLHQFRTRMAQYLHREAVNAQSNVVVMWTLENLRSSFILDLKPSNLTNLYHDENDRSAMHIAASNGNFFSLNMMIGFGYSECLKDGRGRNVMDIAVEKGRGRVIARLLNHRYPGLDLKGRKFNIYSTRWSWAAHGYICQGPWLDRAMQEYARASTNPETFDKRPFTGSEAHFFSDCLVAEGLSVWDP